MDPGLFMTILTRVVIYMEFTLVHGISTYSETWELGTPNGLGKSVLNSEVALFL